MLEKYVNKVDVVSVVGMCKNAGKTTVVNQLIKDMFNDIRFGLTSIGIDGETLDIVTNTHKPEIYVPKGTLIVTAKKTLNEGDITYRVLKVFDFHTPLGKLILIDALSDGFVKIAGPSFNNQLEYIVDELKRFGAKKIIVDGAASRKQLAKSSICNSLILATGASYNSNINKVVQDTELVANILEMDLTNEPELVSKVLEKSKVGLIQKDNSLINIKTDLGFESANEIFKHVNEFTTHIVINGAITDTLLKSFFDKRKLLKRIEIVVSNPVNVIANSEMLEKFYNAKISMKAYQKAELLFISYNPISAYGYSFDKEEFKYKLKKSVNVDIINVVGG